MDIVRQIDVFDNKTELLVEEFPLPTFDLEVFKQRFHSKADDPLMFEGYEISPSTVDLFPNVNFDFEKYSYFVVCYQA